MLKLFLILLRTSATRTVNFVVVNDRVFWVSFVEMALEYFVFCFCLFASVMAFCYAGQPLYTVVCETPQFAHFACSFDSLQLFTVCFPAHRRHLNFSLQSLAEWPNFWHLKHCLIWGGFLLGSQRWSTQFNAMFDCGCYIVCAIRYHANEFRWFSGGPACYPKHLDNIHSNVVEKFFLHFFFFYAMMNIYDFKTGLSFGFWKSVSSVNRSVRTDKL